MAEGAYQGDEGDKYILKTAATPKDLRITELATTSTP